MSDNIKAILIAFLGYGAYALHDVVAKYLGASYTPVQIIFFSMLFGFPLVVIMLIRDAEIGNLRPRHPWWSFLRAILFIGAQSCIIYAFSNLPLTQVYAILFCVPLLITLLAVPVLGERIGVHRGGAVMAGLVGAFVAIRPDAAGFSVAHMIGMFGALCSAGVAVIVRKIGRNERDIVLMVLPMLAIFFAMGLVMPFHYVPMPVHHLGGMALLSVLGLVGLMCMILAYKRGEVSAVAPIMYSQILWAALYGFVFFDEVPDQNTLAGLPIIITSGLYIVWRESRPDVSRHTPVLQNRSRLSIGVSLRTSHFLQSEASEKSDRQDKDQKN